MLDDLLTEVDILESVDEYAIYAKYLGFEPIIGEVYNSIIRLNTEDAIPSFGVYVRKKFTFNHNTEYMWKDLGLPGRNFGDIFDLVSILFPISSPDRFSAVYKVAEDFGLITFTDSVDENTKKHLAPTIKDPAHIKVQYRKYKELDLSFWEGKYNVLRDIRAEYYINCVETFWLRKDGYPIYPRQGYSYLIHNRYQIYQPYQDKRNKFCNNWLDHYVPGWEQRQHNNNLIITKAYKDVACLAEFRQSLNFDVIGPRGENIMLPKKCIDLISKSYDNVITLMDNDGKTSADKYPFRKTIVPLESGTKDPSDFKEAYGVKKTHNLLNKLLNG